MNIYGAKYKSLLCLLGFICFQGLFSQQDQRIADSLENIYNETKLEGLDKLKLLNKLAYHETKDLYKAIGYANELIKLSDSLQDNYYLFQGHMQKGYKYKNLGKYEQALTEFIECRKIADDLKDPDKLIGLSYSLMGEINGKLDNVTTALEYYEKAIQILSKTTDTKFLAAIQTNYGEIYLKDKKYDLAKPLFEKALPIYIINKDSTKIAVTLGNLGMVYSGQEKDSLAEVNLNKAIIMLEDRENNSPICTFLLSLADIYERKNDFLTAINYAKKSLELAEQNKLQEKISDANIKIANLYDSIGDIETASEYRKKYIDYIESSFHPEANKTADLLRYYEVSQKQAENDKLIQKRKTQRIIFYSTSLILFFILWLSVVLYRKNKFVRAANKIISSEKQRSDNLLLNILPEETAKELKDKGKVQAKRFESVTVLFTDFAGFTRYAEHLPPEDVVTTIDFYFSKFDEIIEKYGLEKIKTVGDAYMCAGGLPVPTKDHAHKVVLAAMEIMNFVNDVKSKSDDPLTQFDIRIGINTGPVVAGVVGSKKFAYDIWGDSVNIASRMESYSQPGKINISENTYRLVKDKINCKFRGNIEVKNHGELNMYFVDCMS